MRKRIFILGLIFLIAVSSALAAGKGQPQIKFLEVFSGSMGGSWYSVGAETAAILREKIPGIDARVAPGGGTANPGIIQDKEGLIGLTYTGTAYEAYKGIGDFNKPHQDIRHIISLYSMPFLWITLRNNNINSVYDLANKRISPGRTGQTGLTMAKVILEAHGITFDSITKNGGTVSLLGDSERLNMLRDRNLDAVSGLFPLNHSELQSLCLNPGIKLIGLDEKKIDKLVKKVPGLVKVKIPAGKFDKNQKEDIYTVVAITSLIGHKSLDNDLVYKIVKAMMEGKERYNKYFPAEDNVMLEPLMGKGKLPAHPGALKYFREKGLIK